MESISINDLDLAKDCDVPFEFAVISPKTEKPVPGVFFSVLGDHSDTVKDYTRKELNKRRQQDALRVKKGKSEDVTPIEDDEDFSIESCVVRVVSWKGIKEECNQENKRKLFKMNADLRSQILRQSSNIGNFTKL